jgi:pyruvate kinase
LEYQIPTRPVVADVADVVRQRADALMLLGKLTLSMHAANEHATP